MRIIKEKGLSPEMVKVVAGAAGGPKWIVLYGLDRMLFSRFFKGREESLYLLGSSIGGFRFSAVMGGDPVETLNRFLHAYIHQSYTDKPTPEDVTSKTRAIIHAYLGEDGEGNILNHPYLRLNIIGARCRGLAAMDGKIPQILGLLPAFMGNLAMRKSLGLFFERTLFYDKRDKAPFHGLNNFPTSRVPLSRNNLRDVILASGSIPLVMSGVRDIAGTQGGTYRDGGMLDYHMDIPYGLDDGIVLFPHYTDRIIPGWLDKSLSYRKPESLHVDRMLMVCPSRDFIRSLPCGKIPDRHDFFTFKGRDDDRFACWKTVADRSLELSEAFEDAVSSGRISSFVKPFNV